MLDLIPKFAKILADPEHFVDKKTTNKIILESLTLVSIKNIKNLKPMAGCACDHGDSVDIDSELSTLKIAYTRKLLERRSIKMQAKIHAANIKSGDFLGNKKLKSMSSLSFSGLSPEEKHHHPLAEPIKRVFGSKRAFAMRVLEVFPI